MSEQKQPGAGTQNGAEEWKEIFRQFESQVRREAARVVGEAQDADWSSIGRRTDETVRRNVAKNVGLQPDADWETIGKRVEVTVRNGVATTVGVNADADWATIGQTADQKVRAFMQGLFDPKPAPAGKKEDVVDPWK
jgi:hypothetical protein